jgi:hypothetical protein
MEFGEYSILWLIISGAIGGLASLSLKHLFENYLQYHLRNRRANSKIIRQNTKPLLNDSYNLERRINNLVRNKEEKWFLDSEYYQLSTLYLFSRLFSRLFQIEESMSYVEYNDYASSNEFNKQVRKIYFALSSFKVFDKIEDDKKYWKGLRRITISAVGELSTNVESKAPMSILEFEDQLDEIRDASKMKWMNELIEFISLAHEKSQNGAYALDRLILTGRALHELNIMLDSKKLIVRNNNPPNQKLISNIIVTHNFNENFK